MFYLYSYDRIYIYLIATNNYVNLSTRTRGKKLPKQTKNYDSYNSIIFDISWFLFIMRFTEMCEHFVVYFKCV